MSAPGPEGDGGADRGTPREVDREAAAESGAADPPADQGEPPGVVGHEASPKLRDAALVLPLLGVFLLLPPFPEIFMAPVRLAGVPLIVLYIFGVWLAMILAALWLARRLQGRGATETRHPGDSRGQAEYRGQRDGWRAGADRGSRAAPAAAPPAEPGAGPGRGRD
ncbi:hypothetical protein ACFOGJ_29555 [Marinibaculum pumilum]|uniref:DUF3311 domain-containing protein n=1 Tax=Marinibaculum pumilum TaxID=1766165 RepID=A0ABV7L9R0_9PROT